MPWLAMKTTPAASVRARAQIASAARPLCSSTRTGAPAGNSALARASSFWRAAACTAPCWSPV